MGIIDISKNGEGGVDCQYIRSLDNSESDGDEILQLGPTHKMKDNRYSVSGK
jgi:hypothetical protein